MTTLTIKHINVTNFKPKEIRAQLEIGFDKGDKPQTINKEYLLKNPEELLTQIFLDIKSKDRVIIDDPTLDPVEKLEIYSPIIIKDEEQVEAKIYQFIKQLCEKAAHIKNTRDAKVHMKLFDEFKTASLQI
ncbi:MAG: hypothetical protein ABIB47_04730 [Candidatus Woesearchaeota archaeon]